MSRTFTPMVLVQGGTDSKPEESDGCQAAGRRALRVMNEGGDAFAGAVAAVGLLELDGRYGAGLGAALCMDGQTIQQDAAVMDTRGRLEGAQGSSGSAEGGMQQELGGQRSLDSHYHND
jgi:isoaspartyl peptidase/L-asparaginase-like protein (Ntn-hydrolase superfamily)